MSSTNHDAARAAQEAHATGHAALADEERRTLAALRDAEAAHNAAAHALARWHAERDRLREVVKKQRPN